MMRLPQWNPLSTARRRRRDGFADLVTQSRKRLDRLGLPDRFTADRLHERMQAYRGREIHLMARPLPTEGPHGLWVAGREADYVFYPATASPVRRHVIIGHEYGHMLFDDPGAATAAPRDAARMDPAALSAAARRARSHYDELPERRAEIFGTLAAQRLTDWSWPAGPAADGDAAALQRLTGLLEQRE